MELCCKRCGSAKQVKNGLMRSKQRYLCKGCGLNFTDTPPRGKPLALKATAVLLYVSGLSMNLTAKLLGVSTPTIHVWLDHAPAHPRVAGLGQPFLTALGPALIWGAGQTGVACHSPAVAQVAREHLLHQHVCRLDADPDDSRQQADHGVLSLPGCLLQALCPCCLNRLDLVLHKAQARHIALQLGQGVRRHCHAFWRAQRLEALRCAAQGRLEAANAQASQSALHPVHDPGALTDKDLALAVRTFGVLLLERGHRGHVAVVWLAAEPAQESALEQLGVEPIRLGAPVLPGNRNARRVDHVRLDPAGPEPAGKPKAVATGLERDGHPADGSSCSGCLVPPALEQPQKALLVRLKLLKRVAVNTRYDPGNEPARPAHLDDRDHRAVLVQGNEGSAQVIPLWHRVLHRWFPATMVLRLAARHIASPPTSPG